MFHPRAHFFAQFEQFITEIASRELILDLGSYHAFRKELARFANLFNGSRYFVMGYRTSGTDSSAGPDLDGDICTLPFKSNSVDAIVCKDVLEHVLDPPAAVREMHRVLKTGGLLYCSVPFLHPYHGSKELGLPDYWRFTQDGLEVLLSGFGEKQVLRAGGAAFVLRAFLPSPINRVLYSAPLMPIANALDRLSLKRHATNMFMVLARK